MSDERVYAPATFLKQRRNDSSLPQGSLKRKFGASLPLSRVGETSYPSPPMSSPPSPPGPPPEYSRGTRSEAGTLGPPSTIPAVSFVPGLPVTGPPTQFARPPPPPPLGYIPYTPPLLGQPTGPPGAPFSVAGIAQGRSTFASGPSIPALAEGSSGGATSSTRTGRKSKAHVASACINCKRAHLSCDVQRPCARCVASGKHVSLCHRLITAVRETNCDDRIRASMYSTRNVAVRDYERRAISKSSKCYRNHPRDRRFRHQLDLPQRDQLRGQGTVEQTLCARFVLRPVKLRPDPHSLLPSFLRTRLFKLGLA